MGSIDSSAFGYGSILPAHHSPHLSHEDLPRTSDSAGFPQQFRGPRATHQLISKHTDQAIADFNVPLRSPADLLFSPARLARALWNIEVAMWRDAFEDVERQRKAAELKAASLRVLRRRPSSRYRG